MIDRRDALIGLGCALALGAGEALRPQRTLSLRGHGTLESQIPKHFGPWHVEPGGDLVAPRIPGSLADRLYSETVTRIYGTAEQSIPAIMLLIAYGGTQSDMLQLHRPESCYPALGFAIEQRCFTDLPLDRGVAVPAVALTAATSSRTEDIVYWTRLGEYLPRTAGEQRMDRFRTALRGYIGDGVLVRASVIRGSEAPPQFPLLETFLTALVRALPAGRRRVLIGSDRAAAIGNA